MGNFDRHKPIPKPKPVPVPVPVPVPTPPTSTVRTVETMVKTGDRIDNVRWQGSGPAGSLIGLIGVGINGASLTHLSFDGCAYGAKFGGGAVSRNLAASDWIVTNSDQGLYLGCVEDSVFERMNLRCSEVKSHGYSNHCIYIERANHRLTFRDYILFGGWGFALQVYMDSALAADRCSDLLFDGFTFGSAAEPVYPAVIYQADRVTIRNAKAWARPGEACFKLGSCSDITLENITAVGGAAFIEDIGGVSGLRTVNCTWNGKAV